ncbi:MAG: crossover junction endodeoxyribonuclease RuvC [Planctomycetota bacterium]|nr:crossover junction endodeoxyribonuclease RuvC [Planctomycetota bacterium]
MKIAGIDPGVQAVGYGVLDFAGGTGEVREQGVIRPAKGPLPARLSRIYTSLRKILEKHRPDCVAVEDLFYGKNARSLIKIGEGRGVILLAAAELGIPVAEYSPAEVKQSVTGSGRADKAQVQQMVKAILRLKEIPRPDHTADALAIALCHAFRRKPS